MSQQNKTFTEGQDLTHAIVFADVDEFESVHKGLIGPLFFASEQEALKRFAAYIQPYLVEESSVRNSCVAALARHGVDVGAEMSIESIRSLPLQALQALCDAFVLERSCAEGRQCFFVIKPILS